MSCRLAKFSGAHWDADKPPFDELERARIVRDSASCSGVSRPSSELWIHVSQSASLKEGERGVQTVAGASL